MQRFASLARALAIASCIPLVVIAARRALEWNAFMPADALAIDALASATSLALLAIAAASLGPEPIARRLGLGRGRLSPSRVALAALGLAGLSHAADGVMQLCGVTSPGLARIDEALGGLSLAHVAFPLFALAIGSACGEELFFRGLLQRGLVPVLGPAAAIGVVAVAFGAVHGDLAHAVAATALGLYLGLLAWRSDSIRAPIAAHALNNAVALLEATTELRIPDRPVPTALSVAFGLTLACVALVAIRGSTASQPDLQSPPGSAD